MKRETKASYIIFFVILVLFGYFKLLPLLVIILFSTLALRKLRFWRKNWIAVTLFIVVVIAIFYGFIFFIQGAVKAFPDVARTSIPTLIHYAESRGIDLPFTDLESLKVIVVEGITNELQNFTRFAEIATREFVILIIGLVVAVGLFLNGRIDLGQNEYEIKNNLYSSLARELSGRFISFYNSFATVMGAQLIISSINTVATAVLVYAIDLKYAPVAVIATFLCGILPIVGNLISNTLIFAIALTISVKDAAIALVFLVIIHKLEYFLNSKIIGGRIKNPMWLTLIGLVVGESIAGISGMILAPVLLNFLKQEGSRLEASKNESSTVAG